MSEGVQPIVTRDFSIQAAENEGMPPRPDSEPISPPISRSRRRTGTLCLVQSKGIAATGGAWSPREDPARQEKKPTKHPLARLISKPVVVAGVIASLAFPVFAQDGTGALPDNAQARSYGNGWDCDFGYRVHGADCLAIEIPENAYATGRSYGKGWTCRRGYEEAGGISCNPIPVPANAFLRSSGYVWQCERGYRQERDTCVPIILPDNAYLTGDTSGSGWRCDRGFSVNAGGCLAIAVPENGYLTNADYGPAWACERGFVEVEGHCNAVVVPENAFLDPDSYGPGWRCERGYESRSGACVAIDLPENAHLDRSGNQWDCDRSFKLSDGECVLER